MSNKIGFTKVRDVKSPARAGLSEAGIDLYVPEDFPFTIVGPGQSILIPSGVKVRIPKGNVLIAFNKSGVAVKKNLHVGACVIDESYTGEIHINMTNVGREATNVSPGDKILQLVLIKQEYLELESFKTTEELYTDHESTRGEGGFGSTGTV